MFNLIKAFISVVLKALFKTTAVADILATKAYETADEWIVENGTDYEAVETKINNRYGLNKPKANASTTASTTP